MKNQTKNAKALHEILIATCQLACLLTMTTLCLSHYLLESLSRGPSSATSSVARAFKWRAATYRQVHFDRLAPLSRFSTEAPSPVRNAGVKVGSANLLECRPRWVAFRNVETNLRNSPRHVCTRRSRPPLCTVPKLARTLCKDGLLRLLSSDTTLPVMTYCTARTLLRSKADVLIHSIDVESQSFGWRR